MIGVWNPDLFAQYRAAPSGSLKRHLENRLYIENEPLVKTLVAQMLGQGTKRAGQCIPAALRRQNRAEHVEDWDDAMASAGVAFTKFLADYDPTRGKISFFLGQKIRYELQCLIQVSENIAIRRAAEAHPELHPVGFVRDDGDDEGMGFDEIVHRQRVDDGESAEAIEFGEIVEEPKVYSLPRRPIDVFLDVRVLFGVRGGVAPIWPLWNAWRVESARDGRQAGNRAAFVAKLAERGAKERVVRDRSQTLRAAIGARLVA